MVLVGATHAAAVARIVDEFHTAARTHRSALVVIESEPGSGKTRIVQEAFARLAQWERDMCAKEGASPWWPPRLVDPNAGPLQTRKAIRPPPEWVHPPGASQRFGWLAISCDLGQGNLPLHAIRDAVLAARAENEGALVPHGRIRRSFRSWAGPFVGSAGVALDIVGALVANPLVLTLGLAMTAVGGWETIRHVRAALTQRRRQRDAYQRVAKKASVGQAIHESEVLETARTEMLEIIKNLESAGVPTVLVIDDAAWADNGSIDLVRDVLSHEWPVLILATVQTSALRSERSVKGGLGRLMNEFPDKLTHLDLPPLSESDAHQLLAVLIPNTERRLIEMIARWSDGNPLVIRGLLALDSVAGSVGGDGALRMSERALTAELASTPSDVQSVFHRHWRDLQPPVRRLLAIAAEFQSPEFLPEAAVAAFVSVTGQPAQAALAAHEQARVAYWLQELTRWVDRFADPVLLRIARDERTFDTEDQDLVRRALVGFVLDVRSDDGQWNALDQRAQVLVLGLHVITAASGHATVDAQALQSALDLAAVQSASRELDSAYRHAEIAADWALALGPSAEFQLWTARSLMAESLLARRSDDAVALFAQVIIGLSRLAPDDPLTLTCRVSHAKALRYAGRPADAVEQLDLFLQQHGGETDEVTPITLRARTLRAAALRTVRGGLERSVREFDALVAHYRSGSAPSLDSPGGRTALTGSAISLRRLGRYADSLDIYDEILSMRRLTHDDSDPETLETLNNRAFILRALGRVDEALEIHRRLTEDRTRILGAHHKSTLISRSNEGIVLVASGRSAEAIPVFRRVLDDRQRVLGENSPGTLVTLGALGDALRDSGRLAESLEVYERVLRLRIGRLGLRHRETLGTLHDIAETCRLGGRSTEAIAAFLRLLRLRKRMDEELLTLGTAHSLGVAYRDTGELEEAHRHLADVVSGRTRMLGPAIPPTVDSETELTLTLLAMDRSDEATARQKTLIRTLGGSQIDAHHPAVLSAQAALALCLRASGDFEGASELIESVERSAAAISGERHPRVLSARHERALVDIDRGDAVQGQRDIRELLDIAESALDRDHLVARSLRATADQIRLRGDDRDEA